MGNRITFNRGDRIPNTRLVFLEERPNKGKRRQALFLCDCGNKIERDLHWVRFLDITSCGCYRKELVAETNLKHGQASRLKKSGAYRSWQAMHQRANGHPDYINRQVCDRWSGENGFENFYADMGNRPKGLTIERIDNNKGYYLSNCTWATYSEQNLNKANSRKKK